MGKKQISVRIPDSKIWDEFLDHVKQKHGKTHGVLGLELQNILIQYIEHPQEDVKRLQKDIVNLQKKLNSKTEEKNELYTQHNKLRNKHDHLQERFIKSQRELNMLERDVSRLRVVVAKIEKMSLWERLLNRLPSEVKELSGDDG